MIKKIPTIGVVIIENDKVLLVIKRNHPKRAYQLPGGQIEPHETLAEAACRELYENTGLKAEVPNMELLPETWEARIEKDYGTALFTFTCYRCTGYSGKLTDTKSAESFWIPLATLPDLLLNPNTENAIKAAQAMPQ